MEYLQSVLRQEVGFLDSQDASSTTFRVISMISTSFHASQDVVAEKVMDVSDTCLAYLNSYLPFNYLFM